MRFLVSRTALFVVLSALPGMPLAQATEQVFHRFVGQPSNDGAIGSELASGTYGPLITDPAGNMYGTTPAGGASTWCIFVGTITGCGTVFEFSPPATPGGPWTTTTLYSFAPNGSGDGVKPAGGLVRDAAGNLYGTTITGQSANEPGTVFEISPPSAPGGSWTETLIYTFGNGGPNDGFNPNGSLVMDAAGNLYGTTNEGGSFQRGVVFRLSPPAVAGGSWTETVLYTFGSHGSTDGGYPLGSVILDAGGNLYGSTSQYGKYGYGNIFELMPPAAGGSVWTDRILHQFTGGVDGKAPVGSLTLRLGVVYGAGSSGVFQYTAAGGLVVIAPGTLAAGRLLADGLGNLYGSTYGSGDSGLGTVFKLSPPAIAGGAWTQTVLYSFTGGLDGANPQSGVTLGKSGALYGTTSEGGNSSCSVDGSAGCGVIYGVK